MPGPSVKKMRGQSGGSAECGEQCEGEEQCCSAEAASPGALCPLHPQR